jgi:hypothetical protein
MHLDEKYLDPVMEAVSKPGRTNGHYVMVCYVFCDGRVLCPRSDRQLNQQLYDLAPFGDKKI